MHEDLLVFVLFLQLIQSYGTSEEPICVLRSLVIRDWLVISFDSLLSVLVLQLVPINTSLLEVIVGHDAQNCSGS